MRCHPSPYSTYHARQCNVYKKWKIKSENDWSLKRQEIDDTGLKWTRKNQAQVPRRMQWVMTEEWSTFENLMFAFSSRSRCTHLKFEGMLEKCLTYPTPAVTITNIGRGFRTIGKPSFLRLELHSKNKDNSWFTRHSTCRGKKNREFPIFIISHFYNLRILKDFIRDSSISYIHHSEPIGDIQELRRAFRANSYASRYVAIQCSVRYPTRTG